MKERFSENGGIVMLRYGQKFKLTQELLDVIATYMDDDIREDIHFRFVPCEPDLFLREYVKRDSEFAELLRDEFGIEMEDI